MKNKALYAFLIYQILGIFASPSFAQQSNIKLKKYKVEILPLKKEVQKKYQLKLVHPYSFRLKTIQKCLVALRFKEKNTVNAHKGRVFSNGLVKRLAPLIQDRFSRANSNQRVAFRIVNASGKAYIQGDTFLTPEGLQWRLTNVRGVRWGIEDFSVSGEPWGLVLQKGQIYKQRYWRGATKIAQDITNWVIFEDVLPISSRKLPDPVQKPQNQKNKETPSQPAFPDIKERLRILDELRRERVITEKEYAEKRREILGQF